MHNCITHFSLWNHTLWSWQVLLNGRKYNNGSNEMFCESYWANIWEQIGEVVYTRWYWKEIQNQWSLGFPRYVCKFGLYTLLMEKLPDCLARAIPRYLNDNRLIILEVVGDQSLWIWHFFSIFLRVTMTLTC